MMKRLSTALAIVAVAGSTAIAVAGGTLTDLTQSARMTVLRVDQASGRFLCVEHQKWTAVARAELTGVNAGDIVRIDRGDGRAHLTVLRVAADEIATSEH
jgi:hypothetical protein